MSPRPQLDHIRRPQIIAAAAEAISERGVAETRISDIAERMGTSPSAILYWFGSKDELLAAVLTAEEERFNDELLSRMSKLPAARDKLRAMIEACAEEHDWTLWVELWGRALHDEEARKARQRLDEIWRGMLTRVIRSGQESKEFSARHSPATVALALAGLIDGLALQATLGDSAEPRGLMLTTCITAAESLLDCELRSPAASPR